MIDHKTVYQKEADRYNQLVSFEDYQQNLDKQLSGFIGTTKLSVLESGAGTGRLSRKLQPLSNKLVLLDISHHMLRKAQLLSLPDKNYHAGYSAGDHRMLPIKAKQFNLVVSGWSLCYLASWQNENWKHEVNHGLQEFVRILDTEGVVLIIESLGTGRLEPDPPTHLVNYLKYLDELKFSKTWVRTDYKFPDRKTAESLTEFFFGEEMLYHLTDDDQPLLPECTGFWKINHSELLDRLIG